MNFIFQEVIVYSSDEDENSLFDLSGEGSIDDDDSWESIDEEDSWSSDNEDNSFYSADDQLEDEASGKKEETKNTMTIDDSTVVPMCIGPNEGM